VLNVIVSVTFADVITYKYYNLYTMSDTRGHKKPQNQYDMGSRKMRPYTKDSNPYPLKEIPEHGRATGITKLGRLVAKNANRAQRKAARQQGSKYVEGQLQEDLTDLKETNYISEKGQWLVWYMLKERCDINTACEVLRDKEHQNIF
jgi:hypothetical protein